MGISNKTRIGLIVLGLMTASIGVYLGVSFKIFRADGMGFVISAIGVTILLYGMQVKPQERKTTGKTKLRLGSLLE